MRYVASGKLEIITLVREGLLSAPTEAGKTRYYTLPHSTVGMIATSGVVRLA